MPFLPHNRLSIIGTWLHDTDEVWDCSISIVPTGSLPGGAAFTGAQQTYLDAIAAGVSAWFNSLQAHIPENCNLTMLKMAPIGPDGSYSGPPAIHDYVPTIAGGGPSSTPFPGFNSLAYTWTSARQRPPGKYGRIFPPNCAQVIDNSNTSFRIPVTYQQDNVQAAYALLTAVANSGAGIPVIASKVGSGMLAAITSVSSDNIVDVQRRRKNRISGTRLTHVYP